MTEHTLRIGDVHMAFRQATEAKAFSLVRWLTERASHHRFLIRPSGTSAWRSVWIKPDAAAILEASGVRRHVFIEVDLDSVSPAKLRQKLAAYELYQRTAFREVYRAETFIVAFVTVDEERARTIVKLASDSLSVSTIVTTFEAVEREGPLTEIWQTNQKLEGLLSPLDRRLWHASKAQS